MSAATPGKGGWLGQNYDKLALIVVLVGLLVSALMLVVRIGLERMALAGGVPRPAAPKQAQPVNLDAYQPKLQALMDPFQSGTYSNKMMVSELRVWSVNSAGIRAPIPYDALVCPFSGEKQPPIIPEKQRDTDRDGMKDVYEKEMGFDPLNAEDAQFDRDGDGFTNLEEAQFGTNPLDPRSFPDLTAKLRLVGTRTIPFVFRFQGVQELPDGKRFLLNVRSLERSHFVKVGDQVGGFTVLRFAPDAPDGPTLTLQKGKEIIDLVKGRKVDKAEIVALMVFLLDGSTYKVRADDTITLKDHTYKIIDIKRNTVSIRDVDSGKFYQIGRLSDSEKAELLEKRSGGAGAASPRGENVLPPPGPGGMVSPPPTKEQ